jgi:hypothetical protein
MAVAKTAMLMMNREKEEDLLKAILRATKNDKRIGQKYQIILIHSKAPLLGDRKYCNLKLL